jgi:nucleoside 2-deoxyribosyltransferase
MPKTVTLCGSSLFTDVMAVCAWMIEKHENAIAMGLHLLPAWYPDCPPDHLAEHEGVAEQMDALHLRKIDLSDEIFVVNFQDYIGESTTKEIAYAKAAGKPVRWFTHDPIGKLVSEMIEAAATQQKTQQKELEE